MAKKILAVNDRYQIKIAKFYNLYQGHCGSLPLLHGFDEHNKIIRLNSVWSNRPMFMPVDRTLTTKLAFNQHVPRPWKIPTVKRTLDQAMQARATALASADNKINILWSGGIDSTALLVAFLQHVDHSQLRVLYSPWSTYENNEFEQHLKNLNSVELVDISGTRYLTWDFDGIFVSGDGGDEFMASVDQSFAEAHGPEVWQRPWQDFVFESTQDTELIDFCQQHFANSGREILTVLEARWWFYACFKSRSILNQKLEMFFEQKQFDANRLCGFFDCEEYESYIYWNIDQCLTSGDHRSWKQVLKDYVYNYCSVDRWYQQAVKHHSIQLNVYMAKKRALTNLHWIALFDDGSRLSTPSLPMLTQREYQQAQDIDCIFNHEHI